MVSDKNIRPPQAGWHGLRESSSLPVSSNTLASPLRGLSQCHPKFAIKFPWMSFWTKWIEDPYGGISLIYTEGRCSLWIFVSLRFAIAQHDSLVTFSTTPTGSIFWGKKIASPYFPVLKFLKFKTKLFCREEASQEGFFIYKRKFPIVENPFGDDVIKERYERFCHEQDFAFDYFKSV